MRRPESLLRGGPRENRLHAGIGYVTPEDEHLGRGGMIRKQRAEGLAAARAARLAYWREQRAGK